MNMGEIDRCSVLKRKPSPALGAVFGANVRRLRVTSLITKVDFAKRCGVGRPYLDKVERGEANPTLEYLERFAVALGVDPSVCSRHSLCVAAMTRTLQTTYENEACVFG